MYHVIGLISYYSHSYHLPVGEAKWRSIHMTLGNIDYCHTKQCGWISTSCWRKEASHKRLHLYEISRISKSLRQKADYRLPEAGDAVWGVTAGG